MSVVQGKGFRARAMTFPRRCVYPRHHHRGGHVVLVYEGEWADHAGSRRRRLHGGDVLFHPGPVDHETVALVGTAVVIIDISHALLESFGSLYENGLRSIHITFDDVEGIPDRIRAELSHADEATTLVVNSLVLQLLAVGSRASDGSTRRKPEWMSRLVAYIDTNLGERLTMKRLAAAAGVSESHLSHSFARYLNCSVSDHIRDSRLRAAARALRHTSDAIQQIAWNLGFSDQAHFTRTFKSAYGVTPTEYRSARSAWDEALWLQRSIDDLSS